EPLDRLAPRAVGRLGPLMHCGRQALRRDARGCVVRAESHGRRLRNAGLAHVDGEGAEECFRWFAPDPVPTGRFVATSVEFLGERIQEAESDVLLRREMVVKAPRQ